MAGRRFTRPRTRVYDYNYNLGENYYRSAIDGLDRKYGSLPQETIEPPKRPVSVGGWESLLDERRAPETDAFNSQLDEEIQSMKRLAKARAREAPTPEEDFENAFLHRREEVKKRFSDKLLDSVGINGNALEETSSSIRRRVQRASAVVSQEEERPKHHIAKWTTLDPVEDSYDETAARSRARVSRARLADLENEMDELAEKSAARERRLAGLRDLLSDSTETDSSSIRLRKKVTVTTTEKRII